VIPPKGEKSPLSRRLAIFSSAPPGKGLAVGEGKLQHILSCGTPGAAVDES